MREKKLIINSILYFLGSLGKGVASIILFFIATFFVKPEELGIYDIVISTLSLLQPVIIFQINDGIYRWLLDVDQSDEDKIEVIINSGFKVAFRNIIICDLIVLFTSSFFKYDNKLAIIILLNLNCIYPIFQQITRGLKNHKIFAISGIINGFTVLFVSIFLASNFKLGIVSFYIGQIVANIIGIYFLKKTQLISIDYKKILYNNFKDISVPMQKYSILLVPNSINQWIMKAVDKYFIAYFLSAYYNGIYGVAHRFPDILIMINNMFYSAWVEQSIVEYKSKDRDEYFSKIYETYSNVLISIVLIAIPCTKYFIYFFLGSEYRDAFKYVSIIYISVIFLGLSSFIGTGYLSSKNTRGIMYTSLIGSVVNTIINLFFMEKYGVIIACISSLIAYFSMWLIRVIGTRRYFTLNINYKKFSLLIFLCIMFTIFVRFDNYKLDIFLVVLAIYIFFKLNGSIFLSLLNKK